MYLDGVVPAFRGEGWTGAGVLALGLDGDFFFCFFRLGEVLALQAPAS